MARKYVEYDNDGAILKYGVMETSQFDRKVADGEKLLQVDELKNGMDVESKVDLASKKLVKTGKVRPPSVPELPILLYAQRPARITNKMWTDMLANLIEITERLDKLETL